MRADVTDKALAAMVECVFCNVHRDGPEEHRDTSVRSALRGMVGGLFMQQNLAQATHQHAGHPEFVFQPDATLTINALRTIVATACTACTPAASGELEQIAMVVLGLDHIAMRYRAEVTVGADGRPGVQISPAGPKPELQ